MYTCAMCLYCFACPYNDLEPVEFDSQSCDDFEMAPEFKEGSDHNG